MKATDRAAVQFAAETQEALSTDDLRAGTTATRAKLKFDRQIVAIARVEGQSTIYSYDSDLAKFAEPLQLDVVPIHPLPQPPTLPGALPFDTAEDAEEGHASTASK